MWPEVEREWKLLYCLGVILGLCWENGEENGNYRSILGLYSSEFYSGLDRGRGLGRSP